MGRDDDRQRMIDALCAPELAPIVDLVVWVDGETPYGANHLGTVRFRDGEPAEVVAGTNPIGSEDPLAFLPYEREVANPSPAAVDARTPTRSRRGGCGPSSPTPTAAPTSRSCTRPGTSSPRRAATSASTARST